MTENETLEQNVLTPEVVKPIINEDGSIENWEYFSTRTNWIQTGTYDAPGGKQVPILRFVGWNKNKKYTGSILRAIRRKQAGLPDAV